jgi:hypothetical protein
MWSKPWPFRRWRLEPDACLLVPLVCAATGFRLLAAPG